MTNLPPVFNVDDPGRARDDRVRRGLGVAARAMGLTTDVYRPSDNTAPLVAANRRVRLHAAFTGPDIRFEKPPQYEDALWYGLFDMAYTKPGDYLVQDGGTWFVASQPPLMPALCVKADRVLRVVRPGAPILAGVNAYSGIAPATTTPVLTDWPASVRGAAAQRRHHVTLPADEGTPVWTVLLPVLVDAVLRPGDLLTDEIGRTAVVAAAEFSELGWRLTAHEALT